MPTLKYRDPADGIWKVLLVGTGVPVGPAGGSLSGTYPNPGIASKAVGTAQIADQAVGNNQLAGPSVSTSKIYDNAIITQHIFDGAVTSAKIADGTIVAADIAAGVLPTSLPPNGAAGGSLAGTYPNPTIGAGKVTTTEIADGTITAADMAAGVIPTVPTSLPPNGAAGGSLAGTYPNPTIGAGKVTTTEILDGTIALADLAAAAVSALKPDVLDEGTLLLADITSLNFIGAGVTAANAGSGQVNVTVPGTGVSDPSQAFAWSAGTLNSAALGANAGVTGSVTFPVGRFTQTPIMACSHNSNGYTFAMAFATGTAGGTLRAFNPGASPTVGTGVIQWIAVQMTSTSAAG